MSSSSNRESHSKDVKISPGAVVCLESKLKGSISIGSMTIIHPKAFVIAEAGPVIIGENNIIEEQASIVYRATNEVEKENSVPLNIGVNNVFEVGCEVHAKSIGDHNVFESKCYVGPNVEIGNGCIIGAGCRITVAERLPDLTVITGRECVRRGALDKPPGSEDLTRQLDELTVMSEIFTKEEFTSNSSNDEVYAIFDAHIPLPSDFTLSLSQESGQTSFSISHLPPIRLVASLPKDYPSVSCPDITLSCSWLSKQKLELLVAELDKLWDENKCEILYIWCSFLRDQSLELLNITNSYELSEKGTTPRLQITERHSEQIQQSYKDSSPRFYSTEKCSEQTSQRNKDSVPRFHRTEKWSEQTQRPYKDSAPRLHRTGKCSEQTQQPYKNSAPRFHRTEKWSEQTQRPYKDSAPRFHRTEKCSEQTQRPYKDSSPRLSSTEKCSEQTQRPYKDSSPRLSSTEKCSEQTQRPYKDSSPRLSITEKCSEQTQRPYKASTPRLSSTEKCSEQTQKPNKTYYHSNAKKDERNNNRFDRNTRRYGWRKKYDDKNDLRDSAKVKQVKDVNEKLKHYHKDGVKQLFFHMIDYNACKAKEEFNKCMQDCNVCFCQVMGEQCRQLNCGHTTCLDCLRRLCQVHIQQGTMESIVCPQESCGLELSANLIHELVSKDLYERYDRLMLNRTLDKITNMTYCPRQACQYPISTQDEESLAVCPSCRYAFCIYCKRVYHGIEGCKLKNEEKSRLVEAYKNADREQRLELEKRYSKKQLTELLNTAETEAWMSQNSKQCPCCKINIEKNDGCNKMICRKCNTNFCWLCLTRVSSLNPYLHFQDPKSKCFNLLFEGTFEEDENAEEGNANAEEEVDQEEEVIPDEATDLEDEIDLI